MRIAVVNVATAGYEMIAKPLLNSVVAYAPHCAMFSFSRLEDIGSPSHADDPYAFKIFAIEYVRKLGYEIVIWCDSPFRLTKPIDEWVAEIESAGVYLQRDGWTTGQWANDTALAWFNVDRDTALTLSNISAGIIGFDFRTPIADEFLALWRKSYEAGCFRGAWTNKNKSESQDDRCLGHRHDQTCAELTAHTLGIPLHPLVTGSLFRAW